MLVTYEEFAKAHRYQCVRLSALVQQAKNQQIDIDTLIQQANAKKVVVVKWA